MSRLFATTSVSERPAAAAPTAPAAEQKAAPSGQAEAAPLDPGSLLNLNRSTAIVWMVEHGLDSVGET
jgi:hypothetical protein